MYSSTALRMAPGPMTDRMLDAAVELLADNGSAGLKLAAVARRMGVSSKPVRTRVADPAGLMVAVWDLRLGHLLSDDLRTCIEGLTTARATGDTQLLQDGLARMLDRNPHRDAAAELLVVARFHPELRDRVDLTLGQQVRHWLADCDEQAAARAFVLCMALGLLIMARTASATHLDLAGALPTWSTALTTERTAGPLPRRDATHMDEYPDLAPDDPALNILLNTALEQIGSHGFDNLTVAQIAHQAGFTEGLVFSRYVSKLEMFTDATTRQNEAGWQLNHEYTAALEQEFTKGIAEAIWIREVQLPSRAIARSLQLEQIHLSWQHSELAMAQESARVAFRADLLEQPGWADYESQTDFYLHVAFSLGTYLLPFLDPECHRLPYDAVTVPLYEEFAARVERAPDR